LLVTDNAVKRLVAMVRGFAVVHEMVDTISIWRDSRIVMTGCRCA
jgi:hypothetical protein